MAPALQFDARLDIRPEALRAMLDDLPDVIQEWPALAESERISWSLDWDQLMGALAAVLDPAYRSGAMRREQREQYREALARLREALPSLRDLGLAFPQSSLGQASDM